MDILIKNVKLCAMDDADSIWDNAYVGITAGKISYRSKTPPNEAAAREIDGHGKALMPGFVNAHTHIPMTLLRGYADDLELKEWLFDHIFPAEDKLTRDMVYTASQLAVMEMLQSGTVSFTDMYFESDMIAKAAIESGMKANLNRPLTGDSSFDPKSDERLRQADELRAAFHGYDNGRIRIDAAVHAEYTSCPGVWEAAANFAKKHDLRMHTHISETRSEHEECLARHGLTPTAVLAKHGIFDVPVTAAHCVHITADDIEILLKKQATAVHNPVSNLKLNSGIAPVPAMMAAGVNVALGTDGMASNNSHDMFEEIKLSALLHQNQSRLRADGALRLATRNGAKSQGRESETGQIDVGFDADLILIDLNRPHLAPVYRLHSALCYAARGSDVTMTMVRGKILYENGVFHTVDCEKVLSEVRRMSDIFSPARE